MENDVHKICSLSCHQEMTAGPHGGVDLPWTTNWFSLQEQKNPKLFFDALFRLIKMHFFKFELAHPFRVH
jgi:hypothetical protein